MRVLSIACVCAVAAGGGLTASGSTLYGSGSVSGGGKPWAEVGIGPAGSVPSRALAEVASLGDAEAGSAPQVNAAVWPVAATADVMLPATPRAVVRVGEQPIQLGPVAGGRSPASVRLQVFDRETSAALGVSGFVFQLSRRDGQGGSAPVRVSVDYSGFGQSYGGSFADRLTLVRLPGCVRLRPADAPCGTVSWLPVDNDRDTRRLTAEVDAAPADDPQAPLFAVLDTASGTSTGDFRATDLNPAGKWSVGAQSGSFTYRYPLSLPPSIGGDAPDMALTYDSGDVDGRTSATNNQASWAGLGWRLHPGHIERRYRSCVDDGQTLYADLCWESPYANDEDGAVFQISLDGVSTELLKAPDGSYRMKDDRGWKLEHRFNGQNDDNSGEYWIVSTPDGTRYHFGERRDSNLTVPVVGDDNGEPCHTSFPTPCRQTWRWNLDRMVDPNDNVTVYSWAKETNNYRQNGGAIYKYDRGGYLSRIEYGMLDGERAAVQVDFATALRCKEKVTNPGATCPAATAANASSYPDVPLSLVCADGASCTKLAPSFFSTRRLDQVTTRVWDPRSQTYLEVGYWRLSFAFPAAPTGTNPEATVDSLWLNQIQYTGMWGEPVTLPPTALDGTFMINRQDYASAAQQLQMKRLTTIHNGLGGRTVVTYNHGSTAATCPAGGQNSTWETAKKWDTNTQECFRVRFKPEGSSSLTKGVFHKYVATKVEQIDAVAGSPTMTTAYTYVGSPAWHHDDELLRPDSDQDWSDWRGYQKVRVVEGTGPNDQRTVTETAFFQGMHGDRLASGGTKTVSVTDYAGDSHFDVHPKAGLPLHEQKFRMQASGTLAELASERYAYWDSGITANGPGLHNAHMIRRNRVTGRQLRGNGTWRETLEWEDGHTVANGGFPTREADLGETGVFDSKCTEITYAQNTSGWRWMRDYVEREEVHSGDPDPYSDQCPGPVVARTVTLYDGAAGPGEGANEPTDGNPTEVREYLDDTFYTRQTQAFDDYGREISRTDERGRTITTSYLPAHGFPLDGIAERNALGHTVKTLPSRAFDDTDDKTVDPNLRPTWFDYDGAGRLRRVWLPTEPRPDNPGQPVAGMVPSFEFTYRTTVGASGQPSKPTVVTARRLRNLDGATPTWLSSYTYLDGLGRVREVQQPSPDPRGGRMVTVTTYDDRGLTRGASGPMWNSSAAADNPDLLLNPARTAIPAWTEHTYDALERETVETLYGTGQLVSQTVTAQFADGNVVTPLAGGRTATWLDTDGHTTAIQRDVPAGTVARVTGAPTTTYTYTPRGELASITDPAGNVTRFGYDWQSRRLTTTDPNSGNTTTTYHPDGTVRSITDGRGVLISYGYDAIGRRTTMWQGPELSGTLLSRWTYDTLPGALGHQVAATRYIGEAAYTVEVTGYDDRYRPTGRAWTIPSNEGSLAGRYEFGYGYDRADNVTETRYPAAGGLPEETVRQTHTVTGNANSLTSGLASYVKTTRYEGSGLLDTREYGTGAVRRTYTHEPTGARRLAALTTVVNATTVQDDRFTYDLVGNTLRVNEIAAGQSQCFTYDRLEQLTDSWTTGADCSAGPAGADQTGPDPFRQAFSYDPSGNLKTVTTNGSTRTYTYPAPGPASVRPHAVSAIGADTYQYGNSGELLTRTITGVQTTFSYDPLGRLATAVTGSSTSSYVYDVGGARLVRHEPDATTVYLDGMELWQQSGAVTSRRYYHSGGDLVAMRTPTGLSWLMTDQQGSVQLSADAMTSAPSTMDRTIGVERQRYLPYGDARGGDNLSGTDRGFLGKPQDSTTKLVALDKREHDATVGRLTRPDPIIDLQRPETHNAYGYAANNPVAQSDPDGLMPCREWSDCHYAPARSNGWRKPTFKPNVGYHRPPPRPRSQPRRCFNPRQCDHVAQQDIIRHGCRVGSSWLSCDIARQRVRRMQGLVTPPGLNDTHVKRRPTAVQSGSWMVAICDQGSAAFLVGGSGSACIGVDSKGIGVYGTLGGSAGPNVGGFRGIGLSYSNAGLEDQKEWFTFAETSASKRLATVSATVAVDDKREVVTKTAAVGVGVGPGGAAVGRSYTWVQRTFWW